MFRFHSGSAQLDFHMHTSAPSRGGRGVFEDGPNLGKVGHSTMCCLQWYSNCASVEPCSTCMQAPSHMDEIFCSGCNLGQIFFDSYIQSPGWITMLIFKAAFMGSLVGVAECSFSYMDEVTSSSGLVGFSISLHSSIVRENRFTYETNIAIWESVLVFVFNSVFVIATLPY